MKKNLFSAVIAVTLIGTMGCSQSKKECVPNESEQNLQTEVYVQNVASIFGTYEGTFPCADCGGKDINLTICEDGTYCLKYRYQDKDKRLIEENGTYSILEDTLVVTVTPSSGEKTYYKYVHGNLVLSDSLGTIDDGEMAELYVLTKNQN